MVMFYVSRDFFSPREALPWTFSIDSITFITHLRGVFEYPEAHLC